MDAPNVVTQLQGITIRGKKIALSQLRETLTNFIRKVGEASLRCFDPSWYFNSTKGQNHEKALASKTPTCVKQEGKSYLIYTTNMCFYLMACNKLS